VHGPTAPCHQGQLPPLLCRPWCRAGGARAHHAGSTRGAPRATSTTPQAWAAAAARGAQHGRSVEAGDFFFFFFYKQFSEHSRGQNPNTRHTPLHDASLGAWHRPCGQSRLVQDRAARLWAAATSRVAPRRAPMTRRSRYAPRAAARSRVSSTHPAAARGRWSRAAGARACWCAAARQCRPRSRKTRSRGACVCVFFTFCFWEL
jgi:hypothetical protein